jgi:MFS family permease
LKLITLTTSVADRNWFTLVITLFIQAMVAMALLTLPVMAPVVSKALDVSPALVGLYVSLTYLGAMFSSLLSGASVARWGAIRVSQLGLVLCGLGLIVCAVAWLPAVVAGALLIGLGYGPITPASSHLLARTTPVHQMSLVFSIKQTGVPMGGMMAGAIVPPLLLLLDWQWTMVAVALACIGFAMAAEPLRKALDADRQIEQTVRLRDLLEPIRLVLRHRALTTMAWCSFAFSMVQMSLATYLVTYLHDDLSYGLVAAGLALSVTQVGGMVGRVTWGYVADRWLGPSRMLTTLAVMMAVCALVTALLTPQMSTFWVSAVLVVFGACAIGWNGVYLSEVARQAPAGMASMATGGTLTFTFLGVVVGPLAFGVLSTSLGSFRVGFVALMLLATLVAVVLIRTHRQNR